MSDIATITAQTLQQYYPTPTEVDTWCAAVRKRAVGLEGKAQKLEVPQYQYQLAVPHSLASNAYIAFDPGVRATFYGYWQPVPGGGPAPLLIHLPGYGAEISAHPELVAAGYNVLHINPLGYCTPTGADAQKQRDDNWPVLPETVLSRGERGYVDWLADVLMAIRWAQDQPEVLSNRIGIFGTSQGGGTSLLIASLLQGCGVAAVAADLPFLTDFPLIAEQGPTNAYQLAFAPLTQILRDCPTQFPAACRALGFIDTMSHAHRLTLPVLLTAGGADDICPPTSIRALFAQLPGTRSYTEIAGLIHSYNAPFIRLALAWFGFYLA